LATGLVEGAENSRTPWRQREHAGDFPNKPKGMHWRTYDRLQRRYEAADAQSLNDVDEVCRSICRTMISAWIGLQSPAYHVFELRETDAHVHARQPRSWFMPVIMGGDRRLGRKAMTEEA
jgi:hypothetical protein